MDLYRRLAAEGLGSCLLSATVIGSGILAVALSDGNDGVALLGNTLATAAILFVLVATLGPVSGAHFNPAVTLVMMLRGDIRRDHAALYMVIQIAGCIAGAVLAHLHFTEPESGHLAVEIVSNTSNDTRNEFRLKIIAVLLPSPLLGNTDIGHEFDVLQMTSGFYAGRWHLRTLEEFRRQHSYFKEAIDALG